jgi:hypothetical protein
LFASKISNFERGLCSFSQAATTLARSNGAGGQRINPGGTQIAKTPPSSMARSCAARRLVCAPARQACGMRFDSASP